MSTYIEQWLVNGSNKSPEALAARRAFYDALVARKADQLRFDQTLYWASVQGSWLHEEGSNSQLTTAKAEGKWELAARIADGQNRRRISYCGWKLAMHAAFVNLKRSMVGYREALHTLSFKDGYSLDSLTASHLRDFLDENGFDGFDETDRPFVYHMDSHRLRGYLRTGLNSKDAAAIQETYGQWMDGEWTPGLMSGGFRPAANAFTFISWRTGNEPLVGVHLLAPFADLLRRFTRRGADNPYATFPMFVDHAYKQVNEPQYEQRGKTLEQGSPYDTTVEAAFLQLHQTRRRAAFIQQVDELQRFVRDLKVFNESLLAFIALHRSAPKAVEKIEHPFAKLAAQFNLLAAVSVSSDVTKLIDELHGMLVSKYLPRADRIRPLVNDNVYASTDGYTQALDSLPAFYAADDEASADKATRLGLAFIESELKVSSPQSQRS